MAEGGWGMACMHACIQGHARQTNMTRARPYRQTGPGHALRARPGNTHLHGLHCTVEWDYPDLTCNPHALTSSPMH